MAIITGTNGDDTLQGTAGDDIFRPLLGRDRVEGNSGGSDTLIVDYSGNDQFNTHSEFQVFFNSFQGYLNGRFPFDRVDFFGIQGIDWLGGARNDGIAISYSSPTPMPGVPGDPPAAYANALRFDAGGGNNGLSLDFQSFGAAVTLTTGADISGDFGSFRNFHDVSIVGTGFADNLTGGSGRDNFVGNAGNDTLNGGGGDDFLVPGDGIDAVNGGDGDDYIQITRIDAGEVFDGGAGNDAFEVDFRAATGPTSLDVSTLAGGGTITIAGATFRSLERLAGYGGSNFADVLTLGPQFTDPTSIRLYAGDDSVVGGAGNDELIGYEGRDTLDGGAGRDRLFGDGDDDRLSGGADDDQLAGGDGHDLLDAGDGNDAAAGNEGHDTVIGGPGNDILFGEAGADRLDGGDGNDTLYAALGFLGGIQPEPGHALIGGTGDDVLVGGWGDSIDGGAGRDTVILDLSAATAGVTLSLATLVGGGTIALGSGFVRNVEAYVGILATPFDDDITIGTVTSEFGIFYGLEGVQAFGGNDRVTGGTNNDQLFGGDGNDTLLGLAGNDYLAGGDGADSLSAGAGDDNIAAGSGDDTIDAGDGNDVINGDDGNDSIAAGEGNNAVNAGFGDDVITAGAGNDTLDGGGGANRIDAGAGSDVLRGGEGVDTLGGGDGNDTLDGGFGDDLLSGGAGNDRYFVSSAGDLTFEAAGGGVDEVISGASVYLFANVENLTLDFFGGAYFGVGNELNNVIAGNFVDNLLIGGAGNDSISAANGNDAVFGEAGNDVIDGGPGIDYLTGGDGNDSIEGGDQPDAIYGEAGNDSLTGGFNFHTDILVGGEGNDTLDGASGLGDFDLMDGSDGDDVYRVDTPADLTFEAAGGGTDTVIADINGAGYYLYPFVEHLTLAGTTPFGVGNDLANRLTGSAASNWLLGGAGNDTIDGDGGIDVLFGEAGADLFVFRRGGGADVIGDFTPGTDQIRLVGIPLSSIGQVRGNATESDGSTAINLGDGEFLILIGVSRAQLTAGDFLFG